MLLDEASAAASAGVAGVGANAAAEETLARLAAQDSEVVPRGRVAAHPAERLAGSSLRRQSERARRRLCGLGIVREPEVSAGDSAVRTAVRAPAEEFWTAVEHWVDGFAVLVAVLRRRLAVRGPRVSSWGRT